jgi:hypothetical protein
MYEHVWMRKSGASHVRKLLFIRSWLSLLAISWFSLSSSLFWPARSLVAAAPMASSELMREELQKTTSKRQGQAGKGNHSRIIVDSVPPGKPLYATPTLWKPEKFASPSPDPTADEAHQKKAKNLHDCQPAAHWVQGQQQHNVLNS